jgi:voltage-gated potassium channel
MVRLRAIQIASILLIIGIFVASTVLIMLDNFGLFAAALYSFMNIIGATFPPSNSLIDANNPFVLLSLTLTGIGNIIFTITFATIFYQILVSVDVRDALARQKLRGMSDHVIITPINSIGLELAKKLKESHIPFIFVDDNKYEVRKAHNMGAMAIHGDPTKEDTLLEARTYRAKAICALYDDDIKNTLVIIEARRGAGQIRVLTRIKHLEDIPKMERSGARRIILPEAAVGIEMSDFLVANG